jgi:hypothetical protein
MGVHLSLIPKQWFQSGEAVKMKQVLGLFNKDSNITKTVGTTDHQHSKKYELNEE